MRVVVTGATGNVASATLPHLFADPQVDSVVGVCRRPPEQPEGVYARVEWRSCDLGDPTAAPVLREAFEGADAVVHLAWRIQPSHDREAMRRVNVDGSRQVFDAVVQAGVPSLVYASSVGAYSPGPKDRRVDESWPTDGTPSSSYGRDKSAVERILDEVQERYRALRVVRFRPGLMFQPAAASEIARYFLGPFVPVTPIRRALLPVVPRIPGLRFQALHTDDAGRAFAAAVTRDVHGAFNLAAEPVLDPDELGRTLHARPVPVPASVARAVADLTWRARLQPTEPGWLDLALAVPLMDTTRAREQLGWEPEYESSQALLDLLHGIRHGTGGVTPVLAPLPSAPGRFVEAVREAFRGGAG